MLIISPFKDYYDNAVKERDNSTIYMRTPEDYTKAPAWKKVSGWDRDVMPFRATSKSLAPEGEIHTGNVRVSWHGVGFCGKLYPCCALSYCSEPLKETHSVFYDTESLNRFLEKNGVRESQSSYNMNFAMKNARDFLQGTLYTPDLGLFQKEKVPIFVVNSSKDKFECHDTTLLHPCLSTWEFYKLMGPRQAYQELEMYISGLLGQAAKEPLETSDETRAAAHGFGKESFRKPKGTKRGKPQWR